MFDKPVLPFVFSKKQKFWWTLREVRLEKYDSDERGVGPPITLTFLNMSQNFFVLVLLLGVIDWPNLILDLVDFLCSVRNTPSSGVSVLLVCEHVENQIVVIERYWYTSNLSNKL